MRATNNAADSLRICGDTFLVAPVLFLCVLSVFVTSFFDFVRMRLFHVKLKNKKRKKKKKKVRNIEDLF